MTPTRKPCGICENTSEKELSKQTQESIRSQLAIYNAPSSLSLEISPSTSSTFPPPCLGGGSGERLLANL